MVYISENNSKIPEIEVRDGAIKERIREIIRSIGGNASEFARLVGVKQSYLSTVMHAADKGFSATFIRGCYKAGINLNWLIGGIGTMWRNGKNSDKNTIDAKDWKERAEDAEAKLKQMEYHIERLEEMLIRKET